MESWREEFYASDYGSQYLSHGRHKISEGGARNGETNFPDRYTPHGDPPAYLLLKNIKNEYDRRLAEKKAEISSVKSVPSTKKSSSLILDDDGIAEPNGWPEVPAGEEVDLEKMKNEGLLDDDGVAEPNGWPEVPAGEEVDLEKRKAEREADARRNAKVAASSPRRSAEMQVILDRIRAEQEAAAKKKAAQSESKKIDRAAVLDQQSKEYSSSVSRTSSVSSTKNTSAFAKGVNFMQSIFGKIKRA